jgi:ABC-type nitrate/sulfonate/bicarbonate transport system permease component
MSTDELTTEVKRSGSDRSARTIRIKVLLPIFLIVAWWGITHFSNISPIILPSPEETVKEFAEMVLDGTLFTNMILSLKRSLSGFLLGAVLGVFSGIVMGWSRIWENVFDLAINFLRAIPKTALAPLFLVWFGLGEPPKILLIAFSSYFFTVVPTIEGVKNMDMAFVKSARSMGASQWQILMTVVIPAALPSIFAGIRLAVTTALIVLVMVEIIGGNDGLGYMLQESREMLNTATMFSTLFVLGMMGYLLDALMQQLGRWIMPWRKGKTLSV